jgi:DNA-binding transcriptional MocR family regulator
MSELAPINFTRGIPAPESFPTDDLIAAASGVLQAHAESVLQYGQSTGFAPLCDWIAACCRSRSSGARPCTRRGSLPASARSNTTCPTPRRHGRTAASSSLTLPPGVTATAVRAAAAQRNLNLADGLAFFPDGGGERFLRLPFCALTPGQIDEGVRRLSEAVRAVRR